MLINLAISTDYFVIDIEHHQFVVVKICWINLNKKINVCFANVARESMSFMWVQFITHTNFLLGKCVPGFEPKCG